MVTGECAPVRVDIGYGESSPWIGLCHVKCKQSTGLNWIFVCRETHSKDLYRKPTAILSWNQLLILSVAAIDEYDQDQVWMFALSSSLTTWESVVDSFRYLLWGLNGAQDARNDNKQPRTHV